MGHVAKQMTVNAITQVPSIPPIPDRPVLQLSNNWEALQKSLPTSTSLKRKRQEDISLSQKKGSEESRKKKEQVLTSYNPWNPRAFTPLRTCGNPALISQFPSSAYTSKIKFSPFC